jgi:hypothetical protein
VYVMSHARLRYSPAGRPNPGAGGTIH